MEYDGNGKNNIYKYIYIYTWTWLDSEALFPKIAQEGGQTEQDWITSL